jgi:flagellar protein FlaG
MLSNAQARHAAPRLALVPDEKDGRAATYGARGLGARGAAEDPHETPIRAAEEAKAEAKRAREAQERAERIAKLLAEGVVNIRITFHVDNGTNEVTIRVIDNATGEVVRHIPPEELATMMEHLRGFAGLVVDRKR